MCRPAPEVGVPPHHPAASEPLSTRRVERSKGTSLETKNAGKSAGAADCSSRHVARQWFQQDAPRFLESHDPADGSPRHAGTNGRNRWSPRRSRRQYYGGIFGRPRQLTADSPSPAGRRSNRASNPRAASRCRLSCGSANSASGLPVHGRPRSRLPRFASLLHHIHTTEGICGIPFARPRLILHLSAAPRKKDLVNHQRITPDSASYALTEKNPRTFSHSSWGKLLSR